MSQIVSFSPEARNKLINGVNTLSNAVKATLGPKGRNVVIEAAYGVPVVTKDGVTVARQINLTDPIENLGANIIKQAAARTAKTAGDGTTTATVLAQALVNEGQKLIDNGLSPIEIKRGYEKALELTQEAIQAKSLPVSQENILQIATISANNDEVIGNLINKGFEHVGMGGLITVEDSKTGKTEVETITGTSINSGFLSPYFVTDSIKMEAIYEKPLFLITDKKIRNTQELIPALEMASRQGRPIIIIADEVEAQALSLLVLNRVRSNFPVVAIKAPGYGDRRAELLKDLALITNAELITDDKAARLEDAKAEWFGSADKVIITQDDTLILNPSGNSELIKNRIQELLLRLEDQTLDSYTIEKLNQRLAALQGKVAVLYVGAATETELKEKKDRIDDALRATKSAIQMGFVKGGGKALAETSVYLVHHSNDIVINTFAIALLEPFKVILKNANINMDELLHEPISNVGDDLNVLTNEWVDFITAGIIDPTLVVSEAITNAVSAANMILLSEVTVHNENRNTYDPRQGVEY